MALFGHSMGALVAYEVARRLERTENMGNGFHAFVQLQARAGFQAGVEPLEQARRTDLGEFAAWTDTERLAGNLHRAYSELRGEPRGAPLDYGLIVDDMVRLNHGQPLRCLA